jgi:hypothetical protein
MPDIRVAVCPCSPPPPSYEVHVVVVDMPTGSRTHPWLYAGIRSGFNRNTVTRTR